MANLLEDPISRFTRRSVVIERAVIVVLISVNLFGGLLLASNRTEFDEFPWLMPMLGLPVLLALVTPLVGRSIRADWLRRRLTRLSDVDVCCVCGREPVDDPKQCVHCELPAEDATRIHLARCRWLVAGAVWDDFLIEWGLRARAAGRRGVDEAVASFSNQRDLGLGYGAASLIAVGAVVLTIVVDAYTPFGRVAGFVAVPVVVVVLLWAFLSRGLAR